MSNTENLPAVGYFLAFGCRHTDMGSNKSICVEQGRELLSIA